MRRAVVVLSGGQEVWRQAVGWSDYEVSTFGKVRRIKISQGAVGGKFLKVTDGNVNLCRNARSKIVPVAALMLRTFVCDPPPGKDIARHLDDNRDNNTIPNLAWGDRADNRADAVRNGILGPGLWNLSQETREKMRKSHLGLANTSEQNKKISQGQTRAWARRKGESK